jgi:hypothetical protein
VGCANQVVSNNTISGFVYDINMTSKGYDASGTTLCPVGPSSYTVSNNKLADARLYGIFVFGTTTATMSGNVTSNTDPEGYSGSIYNLNTLTFTPVAYAPGEYDYFDEDATPNTWLNDTGTGYSLPSAIEGRTPPGTPAPTPATVPPVTPTAAVAPIVPAIAASGARLRATSVSTTVTCSGATCVGTLELTKTVVTKVRIGHTKRFRTKRTVLDLGLTRYTLLAGQSKSLTVRLNAKGLTMARSIKSGRFSCTLNVTSAVSAFHEIVSFKKPK